MPEVLDVDVRKLSRDNDLPESLRSHISVRDMGTRLARTVPQRSIKKDEVHSEAETEAESLIYSFFDDLPDDLITFTSNTVMEIMRDASLTDEQKQAEIEELLGKPLDGSKLLRLKSLASQADDDDKEMEDISDEEDGEEELVEPEFIPLNDPIRLRYKSIVRPQDVDQAWLGKQLEDTHASTQDVLETLKKIEDFDYEKRLYELCEVLGPEHYTRAVLLAKNTPVVLWYTLLHQAETGEERENIMETISAKRLTFEQVAEDTMDQDIPNEVDLSVVGRPVEVPVHLNVKLPDGSSKFTTHDYEQYNIPATPAQHSNTDLPLKQISDLPEYAQPCFKGLKTLNFIQSRACDSVINTDTNILLCAPTGSGKTNVALLALARCVLLHRARAVYISPLKALVQEQVTTLQASFAESGVSVAELSGDQNLGREQLKTTDILVATPEKWDIISRKLSNLDLLRSIGLAIIDEVHILHDERRGSVIESIVVRHKHQQSRQILPPRIMGLSATLPNYEDVATFLNVPKAGTFFFDSSFRPVPLEQQFVGVSPQNPLKQFKVINDVCAAKVTEVVVNGGRQALVFVHSRKDTEATKLFLSENTKLKVSQIGCHHAGLDRSTRLDSETKFKEGQYRVLVCTATLAWGVNLPAAAVIIKGTQYYDPTRQAWRQLGSQDVLQMFGRAGRPGFDSQGLGIILTTQKFLGYFASVATLSLPIQSNLISRITDAVNAEVSRYSIRSINDCIRWIEQTFWAVRAKNDPQMYGDNYSIADIAHSTLLSLQNTGACRYKYPHVEPTFRGELAAEFYISPRSVATYVQQLKPWLTDIDLIRVFARADEFSGISIRRGEMGELSRLAPLVPTPLRDELKSAYAKVGVLLQAYISRLPLTGLALASDMVYIAQSASRLFRAFFEIALALKWGRLARLALRMFLMVDKRMWFTGSSPLRQFHDCPEEVIRASEASVLPWQRYFDLEATDIGNVLKLSRPDLAIAAYHLLRKFPKFSLNAQGRPLSNEWLLATIEIEPDFEFDDQYHESFERYWLFIEDANGNCHYHHNVKLQEICSGRSADGVGTGSSSYKLEIPIEVKAFKSGKYTPYLFVRLMSERWLHAEYEAPLRLSKFRVPQRLASISALDNSVGPPVKGFSNLASHLYQILTNGRAFFIGLPPSPESQDCFNIVLESARSSNHHILVIDSAFTTAAEEEETNLNGNDRIKRMTFQEAERLTRLPSRLQREFGQISFVICRDMQSMSTKQGHLYEILVTRLAMLENVKTIVGFGTPISSAGDIADWLGGSSKTSFVNFGFDALERNPKVDIRPVRPRTGIIACLHSAMDLIESASDLQILAKTEKQCALIKAELELNGIENDDDDDNNRILEVRSLRENTKMQVTKTTLTLAVDGISAEDVYKSLELASEEAIFYTEQLNYVTSCIEDSLPCESKLHLHLADGMLPEICARGHWTPQDAVDWLSKTFLYRRLRRNPGFYGLSDVRELQEWISEAVESTFEHMNSCGAVIMDEETLDVEPTAVAHVVCHDGVSLQHLVGEDEEELLANAAINEEQLQILNGRINYAVATNQLHLLLRSIDHRQCLLRNVRLGASPLLQIPHFTEENVLRCHDAGIQSIQDFIAIEDDDLRSQLVGFDNEDLRMLAVADFVNHFPMVDIISVEADEDEAAVTILIERDMEPDDDIDDDRWYIIVGNKGAIIGFKQLPAIREPQLSVDVGLSSPPNGEFTVWLACGNYIDADKEFQVGDPN